MQGQTDVRKNMRWTDIEKPSTYNEPGVSGGKKER